MSKNEDKQLRLNIIKNWKERFDDKNISKISKLSGLTRQTIYNTINGNTLPRARTINRIEEALNNKEYVKKGEVDYPFELYKELSARIDKIEASLNDCMRKKHVKKMGEELEDIGISLKRITTPVSDQGLDSQYFKEY